MNNAELNRKLAKALGWELVDHEMFTPDLCELWLDLKTGHPVCAVADFSPATDRNHLAAYVLPEVERRGLDEIFAISLADHMVANRPPLGWPKQYMYILTLPPAVLAAAALKVLGGGE